MAFSIIKKYFNGYKSFILHRIFTRTSIVISLANTVGVKIGTRSSPRLVERT